MVRVSLKDLRKSSNTNGLQAASKAFILNQCILSVWKDKNIIPNNSVLSMIYRETKKPCNYI